MRKALPALAAALALTATARTENLKTILDRHDIAPDDLAQFTVWMLHGFIETDPDEIL